MKKWFEILANLLFWLLTAWVITNSFSIQTHEINIEAGVESITINRDSNLFHKLLWCIAISMVLFYANLGNILGLAKGEKTIRVFLRSLFYFAGAIALYYFIEYFRSDSGQLSLPASLSWGTIIFYFTISIAYGIGKVWQQTEIQKQQLTIEKKQAELSLLRSQLHPHFLFNVLNNLLALVDQQQNPVLANSLDRLSRLLRYVVYDTAESKVTIRKEIEFIRNFAELQALRFEKEEIDFELLITGNNDHQEIEPGIFIPFIENAFKYGLEPEKKSHIRVSFDLLLPTKIIFTVINPIHPNMQQQKGHGTGIRSSKERLKLVYPNSHQLTLSQNANFQVHLEIQSDEGYNS